MTDLVIIIIRPIVMCFASSVVVFGGIVMGGAFAVKYTGIMVLQVRNYCKILRRNPIGNRAISGFIGQKSGTRIYNCKYFTVMFTFS